MWLVLCKNIDPWGHVSCTPWTPSLIAHSVSIFGLCLRINPPQDGMLLGLNASSYQFNFLCTIHDHMLLPRQTFINLGSNSEIKAVVQ